MKKQMVLAVMVLLFMAEGCSKRTLDSTETAELVAGVQEAEEWGLETSERETSEETADSELGRPSGTEARKTETKGRGQNKSKADAGSRSAAVAATEDVEMSATVDSGKRIPMVSANTPKEDSEGSTATATKEAGQNFSAAPLEPSVTAPSVETEPSPTNQPETQMELETQAEPETPVETSPATEPETEASPETEPKTAYDYPFDMDSIRSDCIGIGQEMGLALDGSLTPGNAAWWNPVTASRSNQGAGLKQSLKSYVTFHTPGNLAGYGMDEITVFNIYCEPRGNGEYSVYFLFG